MSNFIFFIVFLLYVVVLVKIVKKFDLKRDSVNEVLGGVCSGLAKKLKVTSNLVRLCFVVSLILFGFGFWSYIILWAAMPEEQDEQDEEYE